MMSAELALEKWCTLTKDPEIFNYSYRDLVKLDNIAEDINLQCFKGANKASVTKTVSPNSTFVFNDVFHADHMIPVSTIRERLTALETINRNSVKEVLDSMYLCWILKEEDKKLGRTKNREGGYDDIKNNLYKNAGITIL